MKYIKLLTVLFLIVGTNINKTEANTWYMYECYHEDNGVMEIVPYHIIGPGQPASCPEPINNKKHLNAEDHACILHRVQG